MPVTCSMPTTQMIKYATSFFPMPANAISMLDDVTQDPNMPSHGRVTLWQAVSKLESIRELIFLALNILKIEDYIKSLPVITGEDVQLSDSTLREILEFAGIGKKDVFYHLGCGDGAGPAIAAEYGARAIGRYRKNQNSKKNTQKSKGYVRMQKSTRCRHFRCNSGIFLVCR